MKEQEHAIVLKPFNGKYEPRCAICKGDASSDWLGLYLGAFIEGQNTPICKKCLEDRAPALSALADVATFAEVGESETRPETAEKYRIAAQRASSEYRTAAHAAHEIGFTVWQLENLDSSEGEK